MVNLYKTSFIFLLGLFVVIKAYSQENVLTTSFVFEESINIKLVATINEDRVFKVELTLDDNAKESFSISPLRLDVFEVGMAQSVKKVLKDPRTVLEIKELIKPATSSLFLELLAASNDISTDSPIAGELEISDSVKISCILLPWKKRKVQSRVVSNFQSYNSDKVERDYQKSQNKSSQSEKSQNSGDTAINQTTYSSCGCSGKKLPITESQIEFNNGFIENISIKVLKDDGEEILFLNYSPIGFSSKLDYLFLERELLFGNEAIDDCLCSIRLSGVIKYEPKYRLSTKDYSPENQVLVLPGPQENVVLYKNESQKLFEAKIFSDAFGVLRNEAPNGIIQTEVGYRFNGITQRNKLTRNMNFGFFNDYNVLVGLTELKEDDNSAIVNSNSTIENSELILNQGSISVLDNIRFRPFFLEGALNVFTIAYDPVGGVKVETKLGGVFGQSNARDSLNEVGVDSVGNFKINNSGDTREFFYTNLTFFTELDISFDPDERLDFYGSLRFGIIDVLHPEIESIFTSNSLEKKLFSQTFFRTEIGGTWNINPTENRNNIFFRYRLFNTFGNQFDVFHQLQIGYSFNINRKR